LKQTYELDDIFILKGMFYDLTNKTAFNIEEIRSVFLGRCYMVCPLIPMEKGMAVYYAVKKMRDVTG